MNCVQISKNTLGHNKLLTVPWSECTPLFQTDGPKSFKFNNNKNKHAEVIINFQPFTEDEGDHDNTDIHIKPQKSMQYIECKSGWNWDSPLPEDIECRRQINHFHRLQRVSWHFKILLPNLDINIHKTSQKSIQCNHVEVELKSLLGIIEYRWQSQECKFIKNY